MSTEHKPLVDWALKNAKALHSEALKRVIHTLPADAFLMVLDASLEAKKESARLASVGAEPYMSPSISDDEANVKALELLRQFDGLPVPVVRQVLRQAEFWLGAVTMLDCGDATEFARASAGWKRVEGESL